MDNLVGKKIGLDVTNMMRLLRSPTVYIVRQVTICSVNGYNRESPPTSGNTIVYRAWAWDAHGSGVPMMMYSYFSRKLALVGRRLATVGLTAEDDPC